MIIRFGMTNIVMIIVFLISRADKQQIKKNTGSLLVPQTRIPLSVPSTISVYLEDNKKKAFVYTPSTKIGVVLYDMVKKYRDPLVTVATIDKYCLTLPGDDKVNSPLAVMLSLKSLNIVDGQSFVSK